MRMLNSAMPAATLLVISAVLLTACAPTRELFNMRTYPAFAHDRVERDGEPFAIVATEVRSLRTLRLEDRRLVQGMPVFIVRRDGKWTDLVGRISAPPTFKEDYQPPLRTFLIGPKNPVAGSKHQGTVEVEQAELTEEIRTMPDPILYLAQREGEFLKLLEVDSLLRGAPAMLVCIPSERPGTAADVDERCFLPGGEYRVIIAPGTTSQRVGVYPFRLERRNGLLGFVTGVTLVTGFVLASVW